jgi:hypothetical protein
MAYDSIEFTIAVIATFLSLIGIVGGIPQILQWIEPKPHLKINKAVVAKAPNGTYEFQLEVENTTRKWRRDSDATQIIAELYVMDKDCIQWGIHHNEMLSPFLIAGAKIAKNIRTGSFKQEGNPHTIIVRVFSKEGATAKHQLSYVASA